MFPSGSFTVYFAVYPVMWITVFLVRKFQNKPNQCAEHVAEW
jgi:hypothetical protein